MVQRVNDRYVSHYNPNSWDGRGTSIVLAPGRRAQSVSIGGRNLTRHGGLDNGRQVWTDYSNRGLGGTANINIGGQTHSYNFSPGAGSSSGSSSSSSSRRVTGRGSFDRSPYEKALGLGMGMPAGFTAVPGQEKALQASNEELFNRFSDYYDPAIQEMLGDADRTRLPYLIAPGVGDLMAKARESGLGAALGPGGAGVARLRQLGGATAQGGALVSSAARTQDEMGKLGRNLEGLKLGLGIDSDTNKALAGLATTANQGALQIGNAELSAQLQKMSSDAQQDISSIQTQTGLARDAAADKLGYWNLIGEPAVDAGLDWLFDTFMGED